MQPSERNRQLKARYDVLSIPGYVIKKNPAHGARHGPTMPRGNDTKLFWKGGMMLNTAHLCLMVEWGRMQYDTIPLEDHPTATKEVGTRIHGNSHWTRCTGSIKMQNRHAYSNHWKWKQTSPRDKGSNSSLKVMKSTYIDLMLLQDGDTILLPQPIRLHLRHHDGNQAETCGLLGTGTRGKSSSWSKQWFFFIVPDEWCSACWKFNLLAIDGRCDKNTYRAHVFLMRILSACLSQPVVTVVQVVTATLSRTDSTYTRGSSATWSASLCLVQKSVLVTSRHVVHRTFVGHTGHVHSFPIFDTIFAYLTSTSQRASTLCRSTTPSEWRFGRAPERGVTFTGFGRLFQSQLSMLTSGDILLLPECFKKWMEWMSVHTSNSRRANWWEDFDAQHQRWNEQARASRCTAVELGGQLTIISAHLLHKGRKLWEFETVLADIHDFMHERSGQYLGFKCVLWRNWTWRWRTHGWTQIQNRNCAQGASGRNQGTHRRRWTSSWYRETGSKTNSSVGLRLVQDGPRGVSRCSFARIAVETFSPTWSESERMETKRYMTNSPPRRRQTGKLGCVDALALGESKGP